MQSTCSSPSAREAAQRCDLDAGGLADPDRVGSTELGVDVERVRVELVAGPAQRPASDPLEETFEEWQHWMTKRTGFDPSLWFLAEDGGELAGFSLCSVEEADPDAGWVGNLGVRRAWRRKAGFPGTPGRCTAP